MPADDGSLKYSLMKAGLLAADADDVVAKIAAIVPTSSGSFSIGTYNASTQLTGDGVPLVSGTAPAAGKPTVYVVTTPGITVLTTPVDSTTAVRQNDQFQWVAATSTWARAAGPLIDPITINANTTLLDPHDDILLIMGGAYTLTLNDGRQQGFSLPILGNPAGFAGTAVVNDIRVSCGRAASTLTATLIKTGNNGTHDTYNFTGDKT